MAVSEAKKKANAKWDSDNKIDEVIDRSWSI